MRRNVKELARGKWHSILVALGIEERALRNVHGPCPTCGGKDRFRFDDKDGDGTFYCSHCGAGDGLRLVMNFLLCDFKSACRRVEELLPGAAQTRTNREPSDEQRVQRLRSIWKNTAPTHQGDAVHTYLANRLLTPSPVMRCGKLAFWDRPYDVMAVPVTRGNKVVGMHVTALENGRKAPVDPCRRAFRGATTVMGGAVRLFDATETLAVAEGIETALAVQALYATPCWSVLSANGMEAFDIPKHVSTLRIFGDNDSSFTGQKAAYTLAYRARSAGFSVEVYIPEVENTDFWDVWSDSQQKISRLTRGAHG